MPAMNPFVGVSATQPREAASFNAKLTDDEERDQPHVPIR
jgi:hypothetical protein